MKLNSSKQNIRKRKQSNQTQTFLSQNIPKYKRYILQKTRKYILQTKKYKVYEKLYYICKSKEKKKEIRSIKY